MFRGMIPRILSSAASEAFRQYPVVTLTGPRQSGKTTLARQAFDLPYINLEMPDQREFVLTDPRGFLDAYPDGAIIDEIQRAPELTSWLQVRVDESNRPGQYVLTGSHNFSVRQLLSQSLAGRAALLTLLPFSNEELQGADIAKVDCFEQILTGGYPRIYDAGINPANFCRDYFGTYLERDIRQLNAVRDLSQFQTFMRLCAANTGQLLNTNLLAKDCGISQTTATEWLNLMEATYVLFRLQPWFTNTRKRLVKRPKIYFYDTGLACFLLGLTEPRHVENHPLRGALFENAVVAEVLKFEHNRNRTRELFFYRDSNGNEVDLLYPSGASLLPLEVKSGKTVSRDYFRHINRFRDNFGSEAGVAIYAGAETWKYGNGQTVVPFSRLAAFLAKL